MRGQATWLSRSSNPRGAARTTIPRMLRIMLMLAVAGLATTAHFTFAEENAATARIEEAGFPWLGGVWRSRDGDTICDVRTGAR